MRSDSDIESLKLLTIDEVAKILRVSKWTLYQLLYTLQIPHIRIGKLIPFKKEDILRWLEQKSQAPSRDEENKAIGKLLSRSKEPPLNVDALVRKTIAEFKKTPYTCHPEKPGRDKGLGKEVEYGSLS